MTASPTQLVRCSSARPPRESPSRISSVAYALEDSGSEQNTGSASFFGNSVSPSRSLRMGRPTSSRFADLSTVPGCRPRRPDRRDLDGTLALSADDQGRPVRAGRLQLADDRVPGYLAGHQQAAGGLRVGEEQQFVLGRPAGVQGRPDPGEIPSGTPADVPGREGLAGTIEVRHGGGLDDRGDPAGAGQLVQVPEQAE